MSAGFPCFHCSFLFCVLLWTWSKVEKHVWKHYYSGFGSGKKMDVEVYKINICIALPGACSLRQRHWQARKTIYQLTEKIYKMTGHLCTSSWVIHLSLVSDTLLVPIMSMSRRQHWSCVVWPNPRSGMHVYEQEAAPVLRSLTQPKVWNASLR